MTRTILNESLFNTCIGPACSCFANCAEVVMFGQGASSTDSAYTRSFEGASYYCRTKFLFYT